MRDGMVLREAVAESLYLELEEVTPADDGVYACLAENTYGQDNRTVQLGVMCEWCELVLHRQRTCPCQGGRREAGWTTVAVQVRGEGVRIVFPAQQLGPTLPARTR